VVLVIHLQFLLLREIMAAQLLPVLVVLVEEEQVL
jgi:hypothetical protein